MLPVLRWVHEDEVGRVARVTPVAVRVDLAPALPNPDRLVVVHAQNLLVREQIRVRRDEANVGVLGDRPERLEARPLVPVDRRLAPQQVPRRPRIAVVHVELRVRDVQRSPTSEPVSQR